MQRFGFELSLSDEAQREREILLRKLENSSIIQDWCTAYKEDFSFIERYAYKFKDYVIRKQKCRNCSGLHMCTQEKQGYVLELEIDDVLCTNVRSCRYMREENQKFEHVKNFKICDMSNEQLAYRFETTDLSNEKPSYLQLFKELRQCVEKPNKGFYICGRPGVGKTYLACCFINEMARRNYKCGFVSVPKFFQSLKNKMNDQDAFAKQIYDAKTVDVLVLDDIGGENSSNWTRDEILFSILDERMEKHRLTLFTSNYDMHNLERFYALNSKYNEDVTGANRILERVKTLSFEKVLNCASRR